MPASGRERDLCGGRKFSAHRRLGRGPAICGANGIALFIGTWQWEFSRDDVHQIKDAEEIRDHMFKAIYGSFYNAKQEPGHEKLALEWVFYLVGKRESRRLKGDCIFTFRDVRELRKFPDAVAYGV